MTDTPRKRTPAARPAARSSSASAAGKRSTSPPVEDLEEVETVDDGPAPFDLDAVAALHKGTPFRFTFAGELYELPPSPDVRVAGAIARGDVEGAFRRLLGPAQWDHLQDVEEVFDAPTARALLDAYAAHGATTVGESSASTASRRRTRQR